MDKGQRMWTLGGMFGAAMSATLMDLYGASFGVAVIASWLLIFAVLAVGARTGDSDAK